MQVLLGRASRSADARDAKLRALEPHHVRCVEDDNGSSCAPSEVSSEQSSQQLGLGSDWGSEDSEGSEEEEEVVPKAMNSLDPLPGAAHLKLVALEPKVWPPPYPCIISL